MDDGKGNGGSLDDKFGGKLAELFGEMAQAIVAESGASAVLVETKFEYSDRAGVGKLQVQVKVSPDSTTERTGDGDIKPRGAQLQVNVDETIKDLMARFKTGQKEDGKDQP
jgi:hypothetical protein